MIGNFRFSFAIGDLHCLASLGEAIQRENKNQELAIMPFASIEDALIEIREGRMVIIVDDEDRENEGDLVCAAEKVTPEVINFMARHARGLICLPLTEERCDELHLTTQVADNTSFLGTAFTVSDRRS